MRSTHRGYSRAAALHLAAIVLLGVGAPSPLRAQARWHLVEQFRMGGQDDTSKTWTSVEALIVRPDGHLIVLDRSRDADDRILEYDRTGSLVRRIGRPGQGPGEFRRVNAMGLAGDALWVAASNPPGMLLFDAGGRALETSAIRYAPSGSDFGIFGPAARFADGSVLGSPLSFSMTVLRKPASQRMPLFRLSASGTVLDTFPGVRFGTPALVLPGTVIAFQPFYDGALWRVDPSGEALVVVDRTAATTPKASFRVIRLRSSGAVIFDRQYSYIPVPIADAVVDSAIEAERAMLEHEQITPPTRAAFLGGLYRPRFLPPVTGLAVSPNGITVIRRELVRPGRATWQVLDAAGKITGQFELGRAARVLWIHGDTLWISEPDDLDVPAVVRYHITRSGR